MSEGENFQDRMEEMIHGLNVKWKVGAVNAYERLWTVCYLCVREGATQGRGAGGGEAHSPPLLLQRPGQLFKLHLLLPDRLQQSRCALTLLHTHYTAPRGKRGGGGGITHIHTASYTLQHREGGSLTKTQTHLSTQSIERSGGCRIFGPILRRKGYFTQSDSSADRCCLMIEAEISFLENYRHCRYCTTVDPFFYPQYCKDMFLVENET